MIKQEHPEEEIICPHCGEKINEIEDMDGFFIVCPKCKKLI